MDADGTRFWGNVVTSPIYDDEDKHTGYGKVVRDLTGSIEQSRIMQTYKDFVENVQDYAIFLLDPKGIVATWNAGAERFKQYTKSEIVGKHFSIFFTEEDIESGKPKRELDTAERDGKSEDEYWRVRKDGTRYWAHVIITPIFDSRHKLIGFGKVSRDLTDQLSRQRAEEANEMKTQFLANMSHEIRTPMNGVVSAATLISQSALTLCFTKNGTLSAKLRLRYDLPIPAPLCCPGSKSPRL